MRFTIVLAVFFVFALNSLAFSQQNPYHLTSAQPAQLPDICRYTMDGPYRGAYIAGSSFGWLKNHHDPNFRIVYQYYLNIGPDLIHMHHYCRGLKRMNEAITESTAEGMSSFKLRQALNEFGYVLRNSKPDFVLRPLVMMEKARTFLYLNDEQNFIKTLTDILRINNRYIPAYVALADYYISKGDKQNALQMLNRAKQIAPDNKFLQEKIQSIREK